MIGKDWRPFPPWASYDTQSMCENSLCYTNSTERRVLCQHTVEHHRLGPRVLWAFLSALELPILGSIVPF